MLVIRLLPVVGEFERKIKAQGGKSEEDGLQGAWAQMMFMSTRDRPLPWTRSRGKVTCPGKPLPGKESWGRSMQGHSRFHSSIRNCFL